MCSNKDPDTTQPGRKEGRKEGREEGRKGGREGGRKEGGRERRKEGRRERRKTDFSFLPGAQKWRLAMKQPFCNIERKPPITED